MVKITITLPESVFNSLKILAKAERVNVGQLLEMMAVGLITGKKEAITQYLSLREDLMISVPSYVPVEAPDFFKSHLPATGASDGFFIGTEYVSDLFNNELNAKEVKAAMRSMGFVPVVARVDGKTRRGYWVAEKDDLEQSHAIKPEISPDDDDDRNPFL